MQALDGVDGIADVVVGLGILATAVLVVASVVVRWRRARGEERQQLKWLLYAVGLLAFTLSVRLLGDAADLPTPLGNVLWATTTFTCVLGLPAAVAVAVLRHGLYEVDLVINRSLVWLVLSGLVVAAFAGLVTLLGGVAADASSTYVSLLATVVVALLALPIRTACSRGEPPDVRRQQTPTCWPGWSSASGPRPRPRRAARGGGRGGRRAGAAVRGRRAAER